MKQTNSNHNDLYTTVTNKIIEYLEKGVVPWRQPWADSVPPRNLLTQKPYRGINIWLLSALHYEQNYFLTFKQTKELGGTIRKGEKSQEVIFWKWIEKTNAQTQEIERLPLLRSYRVFNIAQTDGIPLEHLPEKVEKKNNPIETCEEIVSNMPDRPEIRHKEHRAYYHKGDDYINIPNLSSFQNSESYYGTLFHELIHSTGSNKRLNRLELMENNKFGTRDYALEELTAEMGASYLKSHAGIQFDQLENNASYIQSWLQRLKGDNKLIIAASGKAQSASDYILNFPVEIQEIIENGISEFSEPQLTRDNQLKHLRTNKPMQSLDR